MRPAIICIFLAGLPGAPVAAQDAPPGALACTGCHGTGPEAAVPLAGMSGDDIARALADFRSGTRAATIMDRIARGFTEAESKAIADWIAKEAQ